MDTYGSDRKLSELIGCDDFLDHDFAMITSATTMLNNSCSYNMMNDANLDVHNWLNSFLDDDIIADPTQLGFQPQHVKSEHSYSLMKGSLDSPLGLPDFDVKIEIDKDMDGCPDNLLDSDRTSLTEPITPFYDIMECMTESQNDSMQHMTSSLSSEILEQHEINTEDTISDATFQLTSTVNMIDSQELLLALCNIKSEPLEGTIDNINDYYTAGISCDVPGLPPTPPCSSSTNSSSDSECSESPIRSDPPSPIQRHSPIHIYHQLPVRHNQTHTLNTTMQQPLFTNPIPSSGILILTEEEKRTLVAEGYPLPSKLPLSKQEEKNLKKIRRKIKNKISAQESRRKKKEYLESLEKKLEVVSQENANLKKKVDMLETNNRSLISELQKLQQSIVASKIVRAPSSSALVTTAGAMCVMVN